MKLYTEEQVKKAIDKARDYYDGFVFTEEEVIEKLKPIELPSNEEIVQAFESEHYNHDKGRYRKVKLDRIVGAKWMKEQILNQNNNL